MRDISARELKGHNILAVERFWDSTRWMIEFSVLRIKLRRYARIIEGHVLDFKPGKRRRHS